MCYNFLDQLIYHVNWIHTVVVSALLRLLTWLSIHLVVTCWPTLAENKFIFTIATQQIQQLLNLYLCYPVRKQVVWFLLLTLNSLNCRQTPPFNRSNTLQLLACTAKLYFDPLKRLFCMVTVLLLAWNENGNLHFLSFHFYLNWKIMVFTFVLKKGWRHLCSIAGLS